MTDSDETKRGDSSPGSIGSGNYFETKNARRDRLAEVFSEQPLDRSVFEKYEHPEKPSDIDRTTGILREIEKLAFRAGFDACEREMSAEASKDWHVEWQRKVAEVERLKSDLEFIRHRKGRQTIELDALKQEKPMVNWISNDRKEYISEIDRLAKERDQLKEQIKPLILALAEVCQVFDDTYQHDLLGRGVTSEATKALTNLRQVLDEMR